MKINKDKMPIKYLLKLNRKDCIKITEEDFLFDLYCVMETKNWEFGRNRTLETFEWGGIKTPLPGKNLRESMDVMVDKGYVQKSNNKEKIYYKIINNPWK